MPRLKEPIPLQKLAFDTLVTHSVHCCDNRSAGGSVTCLRQSVADMKHYVHNHLPAVIFAEFCKKFVEKFQWIERLTERPDERRIKPPDGYNKAALQMMMGIKIVEITFQDGFVYFGPVKADRIRRLMISYQFKQPSYPIIFKDLVNLHFRDLTTFICPEMRDDIPVKIIGSRCSKLRVLRVPNVYVTDSGLSALTPCSELRVVSIRYFQASDYSVNEMLTTHTKLEEFNVVEYYRCFEDDFSILSRPISLVCPSMKRYSLRSEFATDAHLISIVKLFPNLTCLDFNSKLTCDLCILKDLKNLTELRFDECFEFSFENLKQLLMIVGQNISLLSMQQCRPNVGLTRADLNFIYKFCENIEHLEFYYQPRQSEETLVIPLFNKMKTLMCTALIDDFDENFRVRLEFGEMLALEDLIIENFDQIFHLVESMILDNAKFPKLREVGAMETSNEHANRIREFAKNNNLDFSLITADSN